MRPAFIKIHRTAALMLLCLSVTSGQAQAPQLAAMKYVNRLPKTEAPLHRLIVQYRKTPSASHTVTSGAVRAAEASSKGHRRKTDGQWLQLAHLKSITPHSHVFVSNVPLTRADMAQLVRDISQDPRVEFAEIDERVYPMADFVPNDPDYDLQQWSLKTPALEPGGANLPPAWSRTVGGQVVSGQGVTIAVLDSGYRSHADLSANLLAGYDFISADPDLSFTTANDGNGRDTDAQDPGDWNPVATSDCEASDSSWHGTQVAGIAAARGNNGDGIIGVAYLAKILPVRVLGRCGGYTADVAQGIRWAAGLGALDDNGNAVAAPASVAKVINMSFGSTSACSLTYQNAITAARNAGSVIVAVTGNESDNVIISPANCNGVIAVTAHTRWGGKASYANVGIGTTISAPGGSAGAAIYSTNNTGLTTPMADAYSAGTGTSFAAPHVAGVAALLFQIKPTITPDEVRTILTTTARPHPAGTFCQFRIDCGAGLLDAAAAVNALLSPPPTTGGGGSVNGLDLAGVLLLAIGSWALRRKTPHG